MNRFLIFSFAGLLLAGCGAEAPGPAGFPEDEDTVPGIDPNNPGTYPEQPEEMFLSVSPLGSNTTCHDSIAVQGMATPRSDVYAIGSAGTSEFKVAQPPDGRFCVDVPLRKNQVNEIEIWAKHEELGPAEPVKLSVTHDENAAGCTTAEEPAEETVAPTELPNLALGASVASKDSPYKNASNLITDGDPKTWAAWGGGGWNPLAAYNGWVMVKLNEMPYADKIVVHWRDRKGTGEQEFGKEYEIYFSATESETFNQNDGNWVMPSDGSVTSGDGGKDEFSLKGEAVRRVALRLLYDGKQGWNENFAIAEIEVFGKTELGGGTQYVPNQPGTCATLGVSGM